MWIPSRDLTHRPKESHWKLDAYLFWFWNTQSFIPWLFDMGEVIRHFYECQLNVELTKKTQQGDTRMKWCRWVPNLFERRWMSYTRRSWTKGGLLIKCGQSLHLFVPCVISRMPDTSWEPLHSELKYLTSQGRALCCFTKYVSFISKRL